MRLLVVTNDYPPKPGGIQQYLGSALGALNMELLVIAPADGPAGATTRGEEIVVRHPKRFMWPTPSLTRWVVDVARPFAPDAVLFGAPHPLPRIGRSLSDALGVPFGVLCHGAEITLPAALPGARSVLAAWLRRADVVFAVSEYTKRRVEQLTKRPVTYVGAGVDLETFAPGSSRSGRVVIGCVSRFVPRKGQDRLIEAVAILRRRDLDVELLFVGKGRRETALRTLAAKAGVAVRFEVDVPWAALPSLYREMDIFCMPCRSRWGGLEIEGLGLVYLEAAASGLPVIAGASGGAPETIRPGETGFVATDPSDIAEAVELLIPVAEEFGMAGRAFVESRYTWDLVARRIEAGFANVVNRA